MREFLQLLTLFLVLNVIEHFLLFVLGSVVDILRFGFYEDVLVSNFNFVLSVVKSRTPIEGPMWLIITLFITRKQEGWSTMRFAFYNALIHVALTLFLLFVLPSSIMRWWRLSFFYLLPASFMSPWIVSFLPELKALLSWKVTPKEEDSSSAS
jgi:hypothetical protein